ncbi:peptide-methionine (S)-S-oxide reductase [Thalassotalea aquiviva]|uniref:peptide-methionine (S)-S-oxide reductase n=1 Tax=Thalassotalea aquiviva TaxID=3242415 RepID=UPI00352BAC7E
MNANLESYTDASVHTNTIYLAGGCLWGVQEFLKHLPGVLKTEAGRANGTTQSTNTPYDGYAECVKVEFCPKEVTIYALMEYFFEIIDPYSLNRQGDDVGKKYRTGVYSQYPQHLEQVKHYIATRQDREKIVVEVLPLRNYVKSDDEHQDRLTLHPQDYCHIPIDLLHKYKR